MVPSSAESEPPQPAARSEATSTAPGAAPPRRAARGEAPGGAPSAALRLGGTVIGPPGSVPERPRPGYCVVRESALTTGWEGSEGGHTALSGRRSAEGAGAPV